MKLNYIRREPTQKGHRPQSSGFHVVARKNLTGGHSVSDSDIRESLTVVVRTLAHGLRRLVRTGEVSTGRAD